MMSDMRNADRGSPDTSRRSNGDKPSSGRPRPPGPEEKRGATATSGGQDQPSTSWFDTFKTPRFWIMLLVLLVLNFFLVPLLFPETADRVTVPYTFFKQQVIAGNVSEITSRGEDIQGLFKQAVVDPNPTPATPTPAGQAAPTYTKFATIKPAFDDADLLPLLERNNVVITAKPLDQPRSALLTFLLSFGPTLLLLGGFLWLSSRAAKSASGGLFGIGASRAKRYEITDDSRITFADVAGIDEVEAELVEIVDFLREPEKYQRLGGSIPKGVLLIGGPGTGKTLLARAVAGEANVPFFSMSGAEFVEMVVGVGAARVRSLFADARKAAPSIVFVDELDAIGRRRGANT